MDSFLEPIRTKRIKDEPSKPIALPSTKTDLNIKDLSHALDVLRNQPDIKAFEAVVDFLTHDKQFDVKIPSSRVMPIVQVIVYDVVPNYWTQLLEDKSLSKLLDAVIACLRSLPALGAIISRLKALLSAPGYEGQAAQSSFLQSQTICLIQLCERICAGDSFIADIWDSIRSHNGTTLQIKLFWKEFALLISSGKIISILSESETILNKASNNDYRSWLANGVEYSKWLARNIGSLAHLERKSSSTEDSAQLLGRCLSLGYNDTIVSELVQSMAATEKASPSILHAIISKLKPFEIREILSSLLRYMNSQALLRSSMSRDARKVDDSYVRTAAAFFGPLVAENPSISRLFIEVITSPERAGVYCSTVLLRSVYAAISTYDEEVQNVLDISFEKFADELFIKHAPVIQQESNAQVLLLSAGHAKRSSPLLLRGHARSSQYLNAVSKHLSSNSTRVRWLGMIVGTAISGLVDKAETRMTFGDEILDSGEAKWYLNLTSVNDEPVKNLDFHALFWTQSQQEIPTSKSVNLALRQKISTPSAPTKSVSRKHEIPKSSKIVELSGDSEDADLVLYSKPDSDPEDDDEDPTLINRDKPRPPVYIRDLLTGLRDSEDYDRHRIALATAAPLIRRKSGFGKEVSDHAEELVTVLMNLNDQFEMEDFADMRHEALVAIMLADPQNVAELMVASLFDSDYSLQQRTSILTALGLGARELAGYDNDSNVVPAFPSKQLPIHLHRIYSDTPRQLTTVTSKLQQSIMEPLALEAADKITGPNALKVRTFSSRMEVEKKKKKPVPNALSRIVTDKIFFPLTGRWWIAKASNPHSPFLSGHLLPTYLRTLAIILHASGPFALSLPQMTAELWDLLLAVRSSSLSNQEYGVLEALLFAFLMLLEVNENKERLAREHPRELVETQEWARMVLEVIRSGDEEGEKIRALAASVITRCHEVVEKWQRLMVGDMIDL